MNRETGIAVIFGIGLGALVGIIIFLNVGTGTVTKVIPVAKNEKVQNHRWSQGEYIWFRSGCNHGYSGNSHWNRRHSGSSNPAAAIRGSGAQPVGKYRVRRNG